MRPPRELGARLDTILAYGEQLVGALPIRALDRPLPSGDGCVRDLAFRLFRRGLAYVDGMDMGELPEAWLRDAAPLDLVDGPALARYGALVRGRVAGWFEGAGSGEFTRIIETDRGPQTGHVLLDRTVSMAEQQLRDLRDVAVELGAPLEELP